MHFNAVAGRLLADVVDIVGEAMMPSDSETDGEGRQIFRRRHHHHVEMPLYTGATGTSSASQSCCA